MLCDKILKTSTGQCNVQVFGVTVLHGDEWKVDLRRLRSRKFNLSLLSSFLESTHGLCILREVDACFSLEFTDKPINDLLVEIVAAQFVVPCSSLDFDLRLSINIVNFENGDVECPSTKVVDEDGLIVALVGSVRKCSSGWLVDDSKNIHSSNTASILCCLSLCIGEVCRACNDSLLDFMSKIGFSICFQLLENKRRDFLRSVVGSIDVGLPISPHVSLDRNHGTLWIGYGLSLGSNTDQTLSVFVECDNGGCGTCTLCIGDNNGFTVFDCCYTAVGCS